MSTSRLRVVVATLLFAGAAAPTTMQAVASSWGGGSGGSCANSGCTTAYAVPLPVPQVMTPTSTDATTDYYTVTERKANLSVIPGKTTPMWTYNGTWPGPLIRATSGRQVKIHVVNNLDGPTSLHNHGAHVTPISDGGPTDTFPTGMSKDYTYPNNQSARTQWFHDHAKDVTGRDVYMGLAGLYEITDAQEKAFNLPSAAYDVPLVLQDRTFNADGTLAYSLDSSSYRDGFLGDTQFVNGAARPYFKVEARKYRFRILNGANARYYNLSLSNGQSMQQIANEAGFLSKPYNMSTIKLAPAERAEVVVDFSKVPSGTSVTLNNGSGWNSSSGGLMRFDVVPTTSTDTSTVPATLRPFTPLPASDVSVRRTFKISQDRGGMWTFNGQMYDPQRIDANVALNATEEWTFDNRSGQDHPIHLHDINFHVVNESWQSPTGPDTEWKETINLPSWSSVTIRVKFPDYTGIFPFHCHILEHEDNMLMGQFKVS